MSDKHSHCHSGEAHHSHESSNSNASCSGTKHTPPPSSGCCATETPKEISASCCEPEQNRIDWFLWSCLSLTIIFYLIGFMITGHGDWVSIIGHSVQDLINTMWWSVLLAIVFVGMLSKVPQHFVMSILGKGGTVKGLWRATLAGVLLDLCSHGILMVGMQLRKKGASLGQVMAFLIASPWNSLSLTFIMFALIGLGWTLAFIALSMLLAITTGWMFDRLEKNGTLPTQNIATELPENFKFWPSAKEELKQIKWTREFNMDILKQGLAGSKMVIRWLLFGVLLASAIRAFVSLEDFQEYFGPTFLGLMATLLAATIIEVCSEGSTPIAADLLNRANAPGNGFAFLMTGVATDYTEVMVIKDTMKSWKIALFLPLLTVPQVIVVAMMLNGL